MFFCFIHCIWCKRSWNKFQIACFYLIVGIWHVTNKHLYIMQHIWFIHVNFFSVESTGSLLYSLSFYSLNFMACWCVSLSVAFIIQMLGLYKLTPFSITSSCSVLAIYISLFLHSQIFHFQFLFCFVTQDRVSRSVYLPLFVIIYALCCWILTTCSANF
jgi:hypothetical protein